jgi:hypothetical protein
MPNIRLRARPVRNALTTITLRPLLGLSGRTKTSTGSILPQAVVRAFASATDAFVSRDVSEPDGTYGLSVLTAGAHYVVSTQDGTWDSEAVTWDNTGVTFDRVQSVGGVSTNTLRAVG